MIVGYWNKIRCPQIYNFLLPDRIGIKPAKKGIGALENMYLSNAWWIHTDIDLVRFSGMIITLELQFHCGEINLKTGLRDSSFWVLDLEVRSWICQLLLVGD